MDLIDPQTWLTDLSSRIAAHPTHWLEKPLPWNWVTQGLALSTRAA